MKHIFWIVAVSLFISWFTPAQAQRPYTDHKPSYRKWKDDYILDKIEYTEDRTVFHFRFVCQAGVFTSAIFYSKNGEHPWYLRGKNVEKNFDLIEIRNIKRNGKTMRAILRTKPEVEYSAIGSSSKTVFTCEVHFPRLPNELEVVDLIEGRGQEYSPNHFNCFNVDLKTFNDDLGTEEDSEATIAEFQEKHGIPAETVSKPVVNRPPPPAPEPEPEPVVEVEVPEPPVEEVVDVPEPPTEELVDLPEPPTETVVETPVPEPSEVIEAPAPAPKPKRTFSGPYGDRPVLTRITDIECGQRIVLQYVRFLDNSVVYQGRSDALATLYLIKKYMKENPLTVLTLYGHTDVFGEPEAMKLLSERRVRKIKEALVAKGIHPSRIKLEYFGLEQPVFPKGGALNRRVEAEFKCK